MPVLLVLLMLDDGSQLTGNLATPALTFITSYGELAVPVTELHEVVFGWHPPDGMMKQVQSQLNDLSNPNYKARELATAKLLELGPWAWQRLKTWDNKDPEACKRRDQLLDKIQAKHGDKVRRQEDDRVRTKRFAFTGLLTVKTFKLTTRHLGTVEVPVHAIRELKTQTIEYIELVMEAGKDDWLSVGLHGGGQRKVLIEAVGSVDLWPLTPGQYVVTPKGYSQSASTINLPAGALIGRCGESQPFLIGERYEGPIGPGLRVKIAPNPWGGVSAGEYRIKIHAR